MHVVIEAPKYAVYVCESCRNDPSEDCSDACGEVFADDLPPLWTGLDVWPQCKCCRADMSLVAPLVPLHVV